MDAAEGFIESERVRGIGIATKDAIANAVNSLPIQQMRDAEILTGTKEAFGRHLESTMHRVGPLVKNTGAFMSGIGSKVSGSIGNVVPNWYQSAEVMTDVGSTATSVTAAASVFGATTKIAQKSSTLVSPFMHESAKLYTDLRSQIMNLLHKMHQHVAPGGQKLASLTVQLGKFVQEMLPDTLHTLHQGAAAVTLCWQLHELVQSLCEVSRLQSFLEEQKLHRAELQAQLDVIQDCIMELMEMLTVFPTVLNEDQKFRNVTHHFGQQKERLQLSIHDLSTKIEKQKTLTRSRRKEMEETQKKSLWNVAGSLTVTVMSVPLHRVYPGIGLAVTALNGLAAYVSDKGVKKSDYTVHKLDQMTNLLSRQGEVLSQLEYSMEKAKEEHNRHMQNRFAVTALMEEDYELARHILLGVALIWVGGIVWIVLRSYGRVAMQSGLSWTGLRKFDASDDVPVQDDSQAPQIALGASLKHAVAFFVWTILCLALSFVVVLVVNTHFHIRRQETLAKSFNFKRAQVQIASMKEKYQQECIWHEIPISRQLTMEIKALFWSVLMFDGFKALSTNAEGHLVSDERCQYYLEHMVATPEELTDTFGAIAKAHLGIFVSITKMVAQSIGLFAESLNESMSFSTKVWVGAPIGFIAVISMGGIWALFFSPLGWIQGIAVFLFGGCWRKYKRHGPQQRRRVETQIEEERRVADLDNHFHTPATVSSPPPYQSASDLIGAAYCCDCSTDDAKEDNIATLPRTSPQRKRKYRKRLSKNNKPAKQPTRGD